MPSGGLRPLHTLVTASPWPWGSGEDLWQLELDGVPQSVSLGIASETDEALVMVPLFAQSVAVGLATETDSALAPTVALGALSVTVGQASETDMALGVSATPGALSVSLGIASETDDALAMTAALGVVTVALGVASETDDALSVTPSLGALALALGIASELDEALSVTVTRPAIYGPASRIRLVVVPLEDRTVLVRRETRTVVVPLEDRTVIVRKGASMADHIKEFVKDPDAVLDYPLDWTTWLDGDTISTSAWTVPSGVTSESETNTTTQAVIWLSGGTAGESYRITNRIVTAGGRTDDRSLLIRVAER